MQSPLSLAPHVRAADAASSYRDRLRDDVAYGLRQRQKELDPKYFYDERGSELFEAITQLPEYYPTRSEHALLESVAPALISRLRPVALVELGAGSATKTRVIIDAMVASGNSMQYVPVDVSGDFLRDTAARLRREYPGLCIDTATGDFATHLELPFVARPAVFAFLGSTIGNFGETAAIDILVRVAGRMEPSDHFLLGVDLRKDVATIEAAYNDSAGVTAQFNLNILRVINRELGADFDLAGFAHRAFYDTTRHRIEMHLDSIAPQTVRIPGVGALSLERGESIRTELSYKYDRPGIESLFTRAGLELVEWMRTQDGAFALALGQRSTDR